MLVCFLSFVFYLLLLNKKGWKSLCKCNLTASAVRSISGSQPLRCGKKGCPAVWSFQHPLVQNVRVLAGGSTGCIMVPLTLPHPIITKSVPRYCHACIFECCLHFRGRGQILVVVTALYPWSCFTDGSGIWEIRSLLSDGTLTVEDMVENSFMLRECYQM